MTLIDIIHAVDPLAVERARRLEVAMQLLRSGRNRREVSGLIQVRFRVSQQTAWRLVDAAADMTEEVSV
jgi:hypothetical protein